MSQSAVVLERIERAVAQGLNGSLDLSGMGLTALPPEFSRLQQLRSLDLSYNNINYFSELSCHEDSLVYLNLKNNSIKVIPSQVFQLRNLEDLNLSSNNISRIPDEINQLIYLRRLNFDNNKISDISTLTDNFENLMDLYLNHNRIRKIPDTICELYSLINFQMGHNEISSIPNSIEKLTNLVVLSLNNNQITFIPRSVNKLVNLRELHLNGNQITTIPDQLGTLSGLVVLSLNENSINTIPDSIIKMSALKRLILDDKISGILPEVIRKGWGRDESCDGNPQAVFSYLKATQRDRDTRPINELKVLLVGEGKVGKTSLLKRLTKQPFDDHELKTPGITIKQWPFSTQTVPVRLNFWDFGGQRVMQTMHKFFLTKRSLYLLVLDNRKNEQQNRIENWLDLIGIYGPDSPVIIIGNCADEHSLDIKERTLKKKYPQIKAFVEVSCKTDHGLNRLRQVIRDQIDEMPLVSTQFPKKWFDIKTQLEGMQSNKIDFISYEKYQDYCQVAEITKLEDQKTLIALLHDLGVIINFQDDLHLRLNETNVLNPEWVTSGIYDILNNADLVKKKGVLNFQDLPMILKQIDRYPDDGKRRYLMSLLEKFELCFKLDENNSECYLIMDHLDPDEPDVDVYEDADIHFQYRYDVLPSSIILSFIGRNHTMTYKKAYWRSGAVLNQDLCRALVRSDEEDRVISIKVTGNRSHSLLSIIRADFKKIHATIPSLTVYENLVVQEIENGQLTGREVPVDYNYLCDLDRQGISEAPLPNLKGKFNIIKLLEGIENREQRQSDLDNRLALSRRSRDSRKMGVLKKTENSGLITSSSLMLGILAFVAGIFAALARYIPAPQLILIIPAVLLGFALVIIPMLLITGKIKSEDFNQGLSGVFAAFSILKGKNPEKTDDEPAKLPAESSKKE
jgi:internalin A